jgi:hypothetical protein
MGAQFHSHCVCAKGIFTQPCVPVGTLANALVQQDVLRVEGSDFVLTPQGLAFLRHQGVDVPQATRSRRAFARRCLDWSERRDHLAGALGAALFATWEATGLWTHHHSTAWRIWSGAAVVAGDGARRRRHIVARLCVHGCRYFTNSLPKLGFLARPTSLIVCAAGHTVLAVQAAQPVQAPKEGL